MASHNRNPDDPVSLIHQFLRLIREFLVLCVLGYGVQCNLICTICCSFISLIRGISIILSQITCRRCPKPQPTFLYYEDFRAHLRVKHGIRAFDDNDITLFESWPGSSTYVLRRPARSRLTPSGSSRGGGDQQQFADLIQVVSQTVAQSVSIGIEKGMAAVMSNFAAHAGSLCLYF